MWFTRRRFACPRARFLEGIDDQKPILSKAVTAEIALDDVDAAKAALAHFIDAYRAGMGAGLRVASDDASIGYAVHRIGVDTPATIPPRSEEACHTFAQNRVDVMLADPDQRAAMAAQVAQIAPDTPIDDATLRAIMFAGIVDEEFVMGCQALPEPTYQCLVSAKTTATLVECVAWLRS